jgi:hypothetical protein
VDYPTWLRLALEGQFAFVPEVLGVWRRHSGQAMRSSGMDIQVGVCRFAQGFYETRVSDELKKVHAMTAGWMKKNLSRGLGWGHFQEGRFYLLERDWPRARQSFLSGLSFDSAMIRGLSALGLLASIFKTNLEPLARFSRKAYYHR